MQINRIYIKLFQYREKVKFISHFFHILLSINCNSRRMPKRGLAIEALALFEEFKSDDSETSHSEDSNNEDYIPDITQDNLDDSDDFPPVEDEGNIPVIQSAPGQSQ